MLSTVGPAHETFNVKLGCTSAGL